MYDCVKPICCPPEYCVRDYYTHRFVPVIHPIVNINRQNIIDVPQHLYQQTTRNVIVDPGYQGQGFQGRSFPGQNFRAQGPQAQGFPGQNFQTQSPQAQGFPGQNFQTQGFQGRSFQGRG